MTIIQFEKQLEAKYGKAKLNQALKQLEEDHGSNGLDAYMDGEFDMLQEIIDDLD
jgi:hypothetical protein